MAGILTEDEEGYKFEYIDTYLDSENPEAISLTMPDLLATELVVEDDDED